jgi:ribosomal protein S18 acetylase RimI-like enzyme
MTTLRRATAADLPQLLPLLDRYYTEWHVQVRDTPAQTVTYLNHPTLGFLVAEDEVTNTLAACVLLRDLPSTHHAAECKRLYVSPDFRRQGLADRLMQLAEDQATAAGLHWIYLDSAAEFTTAIALYRRRGYTDTPRFNDNPQATVFLRKSLTTAA